MTLPNKPRKKAKFKVGQVVCMPSRSPFSARDYGEIVWKKFILDKGWHYRFEGWTEMFNGYKESRFRPLTKKERGE